MHGFQEHGAADRFCRERDELRNFLCCIGGEIILLVTDINMPGMSGFDLLPKVKARRPSERRVSKFMTFFAVEAERVCRRRRCG
jgi:CheY-like chemotaxis protein